MPAPTNGRIAWKVSAATLTVAALVLLGTCLAKVGQQRELARRRRRLSVKVSSPYARSALREAARHCGLTVEESASCIWADFSGHDWDRFLENLDDFQRVSCFYTRAGLVRKGMLAHYLDKRRRRLLKEGKSVAAVNVLPESLVVDLQDEDDLSALRRRLLNANTKSEKSDPPNHCLDGSNTNNNNNSNNILIVIVPFLFLLVDQFGTGPLEHQREIRVGVETLHPNVRRAGGGGPFHAPSL